MQSHARVHSNVLKKSNPKLKCPECLRKGVESTLKLFQINFHEAIYLCPSVTCSYPLKENNVVKRFVVEQDASTLCTTELCDFDINSLPDYSNFESNMPHIPLSNGYHPSPSRPIADNDFYTDINATGTGSYSRFENENHSVIMDSKHGDSVLDFNEPSSPKNECDDFPEYKNSECFETDFTTKFGRPSTNKKIIQWINEANSCWLDAILGILVRSCNIRSILNLSEVTETNILRKVLMVYDECQQFFQHNSNNFSDSNKNLAQVCEKLGRIRNSMLKELKKSTTIQSGEFLSILEMMPLVLKTCCVTEDCFTISTLWSFECEKCGHKRAHRLNKSIVSFSSICSDFHPLNALFHRQCYQCGYLKGCVTVLMERIPPCVAFHFQKGLPHGNLRVLDFAVQEYLYSVLAVVQYVTTPIKHFITWVRDIKTNRWLCCDDLRDPVCCWQARVPKLPPDQIHMLIWERNAASDPSQAKDEDVDVILNEEAIEFADAIPVENFFAYEDETILVPEEDENITKKNPISHKLQESAFVKEDVNIDMSCTSNSFNFDRSMFVNGGLSINPELDGKQTIQLVAPSNTCSIYIMTNDSKTPSLFYPGTPDYSRPSLTSNISARSFIDNSHSYNMVTQGYNSSQSRGSRGKFASYPEKRQFRLSGYSTIGSRLNFSPIRESINKGSTVTSLPEKFSSKKNSGKS